MILSFAKRFVQKIQEYQEISIFVHKRPDFDAYASAFGIKRWIGENFPHIKAHVMLPPGTVTKEESLLFGYDEEPMPSDETIRASLGIIVDASDEGRILTENHSKCKELMIIDHHPKSHTFAEMEFIDPTYPAVSQILAEMFLHLETDEGGKYTFSDELARYFYAGIMTDTNNFLSMSMLPSTFRILSQLVSKGLNRAEIHRTVLNKPLHQRLMELQILKNCHLTAHGLIFSVVTPAMIEKYRILNVDGFNPVPVLANVPNVEVWSTLTYDEGSKVWKCSLRSQNISVNQIAKLYGGGGHKKMAAINFTSKFKYYRLLATIDKYLMGHGFENVTLNDKNRSWQLSLVKLFGGYRRM